MKRVSITPRIAALAVVLLTLLPSIALAQKITTTTEGTAGDRDKRRRGPVLSVSNELLEGGGARLLADWHTPNGDYSKYPVRVEFYINRKLFSSQVRSPELPGPIGVDVGTDVATIPFNYTVIATVLHPNRSFPTVLNGAVFNRDLVGTFGCKVSFNPNTGDEVNFRADDVATTQSGNNSFALSFEGTNSGNDDKIQVSGIITDNGAGQASTDARIVRNGLAQVYAMSGSIAIDDNTQIQSFRLETSDGGVEFSCN